MDTLENRIRNLMRKWISQANHPQRVSRPDERDLILRHVEQLRAVLATRQEWPDE